MSDEVNYYAITLDNLNEYRDELKEAFKKRAGKSQKINSDAIMDMLNDVSVILAFDCEPAKYFFSHSNKSIPDDYDLDALRFDEFMELLEMWLQKEAEAFDGTAYANQEDEDVEMTEEQHPGFVKGKPVTRLPRNYDHNRRLLEELLSKHKAEYQNVFRERLIEEDQTEIAAADIFIFLQECFYLDEIEVHASAQSTDDFFRLIGSYKTMFKLMEQYLEEGHLGNKGGDIYETTLKFDECMDFLDYWLRSDENLVFVDKRKDPNEGAVRKALMDTIANYEKMVKNTPNEEEKELLSETVNVLKQKLYDLENGRGSVNNDARNAQKSEEKRLRALREIFEFYCTQQINTGRFATFEKVKRLANTINLGTFKVFLKNFKLKMHHLRLLELYKKAAGLDENLDYDEFLDLLNKVALRAEIAEDPKVHQPQPEIMKNYKPDSYKHDPTYKQYKQNDAKKRQEYNAIKKIKKSYGKDDKKRDAEKLEEIWQHMGLYNGNFRSFIGYLNLPFNSQDHENFRIPPDSLKYRFRARAMEGKSASEVKEEVQKRNYMRSLIKDLKNAEKGFMENLRGSSMPNRSENSSSLARRLKEEDTYVRRQFTKNQMHLPQIKKLTMKKLGSSQEQDVAHVYDRFNPNDLIDDNDEDDDMYLAEYNIAKEKKKAMAEREHVSRRKIEQYGKIKKAAKFAVNGRYGLGHQRSSEAKISIQDLDSMSGRYNHANSDSRIYPTYANTSPRSYNPQSVRNLKGPISHPTYLDHDMITPKNNNSSMRYSGDSLMYSSPYQNYSDHNNGYYRGRDPVVSHNGYTIPTKNSGYYNSTLDRANQIEMEAYRRENELYKNAMNIQNSQVNRGLKSLRK